MTKLLFLFLTLFSLASPVAVGNCQNTQQLLTIASGGFNGVYFPVGGSLASLLSRHLQLNASVQTTAGCVENLRLLQQGKAEIALIRADTASQAYDGIGAFQRTRPMRFLRGIAPLYSDYVQVITTPESGILRMGDLAGKRVGVGKLDSGVEVNARLILESHGMNYTDLRQEYLDYKEAAERLQEGSLDAAFVTSGLPNPVVLALSRAHPVVVLPVEEKAVIYLKNKYPFITHGLIPAATYNQKRDTPTVLLSTLLVAPDSLSTDQVYRITRTIFDHLPALKNTLDATGAISLDNVTRGMPIPFHRGAEKYFREQGVLQ